MKAQSGFTLIEGLVAGIISAMVPLVLMALMNTVGTQMSETAIQFRLTQIYNVVSGEIRRSADSAGQARTVCTDGSINLGGYEGVVLCDSTGYYSQKGFRVYPIGGGIGQLQEARPGESWKPFFVGPDTVSVSTTVSTEIVAGLFGVGYGPYSTYYQGFWYNIKLNMRIGGILASLPVQTESVICRNANPW